VGEPSKCSSNMETACVYADPAGVGPSAVTLNTTSNWPIGSRRGPETLGHDTWSDVARGPSTSGLRHRRCPRPVPPEHSKQIRRMIICRATRSSTGSGRPGHRGPMMRGDCCVCPPRQPRPFGRRYATQRMRQTWPGPVLGVRGADHVRGICLGARVQTRECAASLFLSSHDRTPLGLCWPLAARKGG